MTKNKDKLRFILAWVITVGLFSGVGIGLLIWNELRQDSSPPVRPSPITGSSQPSEAPSPIITNEDQKRFSSANRYLFSKEGTSNANITKEYINQITQGTENFELKDYEKASQNFQQAINTNSNEPEPQIYLNNSLARQKDNPFKLAVVVPVDEKPNSAKEMLRGVADAQTEFNKKGLDNRFLEIVIVNDGNEPNISARVADIIAADRTFLGVIGHNSSNTSLAGLPFYENKRLPIISPTSTSTELSGEVFFRTVPSDAAAGEKLADKLQELNIQKVAIFYDSGSSYSLSLRDAFEKKFYDENRFSQAINLNDSDIEDRILKVIQNFQVEAAVLFPSTKTTHIAIKVVQKNAGLAANERLKLFGGDALYEPETLTEGGEAVEGLILAVPWLARTGGDYASEYAERAKNRWGGPVSWRTAMSYDAAKALIKALSEDATRETVLENLKSVSISASNTSGYSLEFDNNGERSGEVLLVEVATGAPGPPGTNLGFQFLE